MAFVTTKDGVNIYYKDWGPKEAQPIVFHHGWPLSADDWDNQMLFFRQKAIALSLSIAAVMDVQTVSEGHDMDHYAADASAVVESPDLHNAVHVGHSTGGGRSPAMLRSTASRRGASPKRCSSAPSRL